MTRWVLACSLMVLGEWGQGQNPPYDVFPTAEPPYYRVRYEGSDEPGKLRFAVNYTIWIPTDAVSLRGVIVHQHGCGEGSCKSGLTGAYDLHWQALAKKHACALLSPAYEQPEHADCQLWCDPRNGSGDTFQRALFDLGELSGHAELANVPWALWGHSGGGHWAGGMTLLHPERVAAAWLRSGVPLLEPNLERLSIKTHTLHEAALQVPILCNLGTKEGVTVTEGQFAGVWPANEIFFRTIRKYGGLIAVAVDPLTSHECGNQRYFAIPWLDAILSARLPARPSEALQPMPTANAWLAAPLGTTAVVASEYVGDPLTANWLPNETVARQWMQYVTDTNLTDTTPPPPPTHFVHDGETLTWQAEADMESGLAHFIIERDGEFLARVPEQPENRFGRPIFQNLQYSDTPTQPLVAMQYQDVTAQSDRQHEYTLFSVNTLGLRSKPSRAVAAER
jgi:pimeloyl-ACP methyl ester carboxylesterase